ncbi:unnamed protein product [Musa acuminata subsp. burmannicoides]
MMFMGKQPGTPMRRAPSSTEFSPSVLFDVGGPRPSDHNAIVHYLQPREAAQVESIPSPRSGVHSGKSGDGTAPFLRACGLCNRRLGPGRDIYMYRGEIAFCSLECRQLQMNLDEEKEKCALSDLSKE